MQTASTLAQAHASAGHAHTPHREHRSRDHGHRRSRQPAEAQSPSSPLVLAPSPAVVKPGRRATTGHDGSRGGSREHISVQPLAPTSRRASQQRLERERDSALVSQHPYAAAQTNSNLRSGPYGRSSPVLANGSQPNGTGTTAVNSGDVYMYGTPQAKANGFATPEVNGANGVKDGPNGVRAMNIYEQAQMSRVGEQDEHGDGRKRGFWTAFCCRA